MVIVMDKNFGAETTAWVPSASSARVQSTSSWVPPVSGGPRVAEIDLRELGRSIVHQHGEALRRLAD